jgi:uncharacterized protein YndB with AHSA1/START domain
MTPTTQSGHATNELIGGRPVLRLERRFAHPPEKVWRAITEPAELAHWFPAKVDTELAVGAAMRIITEEPDLGESPGEILELDRPKVFMFRWDTDVLRFEIVADGDGSRLYFSHTLGGGELWGDQRFAAQHAAGWDVCLDLLDARLDGREPPADRWFALNEQYVEEFGLAQGAIADGGKVLRFERVLVQPAGEVWAALTEGTGLAVGSPPPAPLTTPLVAAGDITAVEEKHWVEYAWLRDGKPAGHVGWELVELPFGCRITLTEVIPAEVTGTPAEDLASWQVRLELLVARLHGIDRPWPDDRVASLTAMYRDRL